MSDLTKEQIEQVRSSLTGGPQIMMKESQINALCDMALRALQAPAIPVESEYLAMAKDPQ